MVDRTALARLVDDVSNRLQVLLGYAQILHELDEVERAEAVDAIQQQCTALQGTLRSLTGWSRAADGSAPWTGRGPGSATTDPPLEA